MCVEARICRILTFLLCLKKTSMKSYATHTWYVVHRDLRFEMAPFMVELLVRRLHRILQCS